MGWSNFLAFSGFLFSNCLTVSSALILTSLGYDASMSNLDELISQTPRVVVIFSHTSYWDFLFFILYSFAEPRFGMRVCTVMSSYYYNLCPWFFSKFGIIGAPSHSQQTAPDRRKEGFISTTVKTLSDRRNFILLISPEGTLAAAPWRSGYYALAKELRCPIRVGGMDYEKKCIYMSDPYDCYNVDLDQSELIPREDLEPFLQKEMENIVPLYPEYSFTPCHPKSKYNISVVSPPLIVKLLTFICIFTTILHRIVMTRCIQILILCTLSYDFYKVITYRLKFRECRDSLLACGYAMACFLSYRMLLA